MAIPANTLDKIKVNDTTYDLGAKYIKTADADPVYKTWEDITSLVETSFELKVIDGTLPVASATIYATYHNNIVLCNNGETPKTGTYLEWVIVKGGTQTTPTYAWEKIGTSATDLTDYVKHGTYTTFGPSSNATGSTDLGSASGTASVTYKKASDATGSAGGNSSTTSNTGNAGSHTINGSNFSFTGTTATIYVPYKPAGSIGGSQSISNHNHTVTKSTATFLTNAALVGGSAASRATFGFVSGVKSDGTVSVLTGVTSNGTASVATGVKAASTDTALTGYTFSGGSASGTFVTGVKANASVGGTRNYGFASSTSGVMHGATVNNGVLSWSTSAASTQDAHTVTQMTFNTGGVSWTAASFSATTASFVTGVTVSGTATALTGVKGSGNATVIKSDGLSTGSAYQITGVGSVPALTLSGTATGLTNVSLADGGAVTVSGSNFSFTGTQATLSIVYQPAGSIGGSQTVGNHSHTYYGPVAHTHSISNSDATASGSVSVAIGAHTHSLSNHTHNIYI